MAVRSAATVQAAPSIDKTRKTLLAKVHIAKKQFGPDAYEGALMQFAGVTSAKDCTITQLREVVGHFEKSGFTTTARKPGPRRADHAIARKARVMWISLALLCAVRVDPETAIRDDKALEAFATRQLGCVKFQWANQNQGDRLIEAIKAIAGRHGWDQSTKGLTGRDMPKVDYVHVLKVRLCDAILAKLKRAGSAADDWSLEDCAFRLFGIRPDNLRFTTQEYEHLATALGRHLRAHGGDGAFVAMVP